VFVKVPLEGSSKMWQHPWQLVHKARLHDVLKKTAISLGAVLHTSSKVLQVDREAATLKLSDGRETEADLMVGADGIM
jgi:2-polyprenyl-6-methoxyphenol hydroxylase-like FAD-dependent oxidoreductase